MTEERIVYKSLSKTFTLGAEQVLDTSETDGIKCVWSGFVAPNYKGNLKWVFDWKDLPNQQIESITGHITVVECNGRFSPRGFEFNLDGSLNQVTFSFLGSFTSYNIGFEYHMTVQYVPISYDELSDVILVIEGKKLHVNKAFLSIHSEFFRALFSSNFKEGQLAEIPIEEISYADFGLLMGTITPLCTFPTDRTASKLLELADRFMMPSVTHHVENHLLHLSQLPNSQKMSMADKYGLKKLLDHSIGRIKGLEDTKKLKESSEYAGLSNRTKAMLLDRL